MLTPCYEETKSFFGYCAAVFLLKIWYSWYTIFLSFPFQLNLDGGLTIELECLILLYSLISSKTSFAISRHTYREILHKVHGVLAKAINRRQLYCEPIPVRSVHVCSVYRGFFYRCKPGISNRSSVDKQQASNPFIFLLKGLIGCWTFVQCRLKYMAESA